MRSLSHVRSISAASHWSSSSWTAAFPKSAKAKASAPTAPSLRDLTRRACDQAAKRTGGAGLDVRSKLPKFVLELQNINDSYLLRSQFAEPWNRIDVFGQCV